MSTLPKSWIRPYDLHTGRELELMLAGTKPLAHFYDIHPHAPREEIIPLNAFAPHVAAGRFVTRSYVELLSETSSTSTMPVRGTLHVFYARSSEKWRIDAYIQMQAVAAKAGWSEGFERLQGALLGYNEQECDAHLDALRVSPVSKNWYWLRSKE